jgi:hypothetical protein
VKRALAFVTILGITACAATVDTSPGDGGGGSTSTGVGAGALGEDGLATTCDEVCGPIPRSLEGCRIQCDANCDSGANSVDLDQPCGLETARLVTCVAAEYFHPGCPSDYGGCTEELITKQACEAALEQGGGGTGP